VHRVFPAPATMGTPDDCRKRRGISCGDLAAFVSGEHLLITGGAPA
jgi:hypothetical protein